MSLVGEYQLLWANAARSNLACSGGLRRSGSRSGMCPSGAETTGGSWGSTSSSNRSFASIASNEPCGQFVFETQGDAPPLTVGLRRARSVQDVMKVLGGGGSRGEHVLLVSVVTAVSLLGGNLVATGQWLSLVGSAVLLTMFGFLESRWGVRAVLMVMTSALFHTIVTNRVTFQWVITMALVVVFAMFCVEIITSLVKEDPRGYVMIPHGVEGTSVVIENRFAMDVKLLVFDDTDALRVVPQGGLLAGTVVPRGASTCIGDQPPYIVKVYAPWERELGTFKVAAGHYKFQATVPPLLLRSEDPPCFVNSSGEPVNVCTCAVDNWTRSLWVPLAPLLARLVFPSRKVAVDESFALSGPCLLHVYDSGLLALRHCASCVVGQGEGVEYLGCVRWTGVKAKVNRSSSSLAEHVQ